MNAKDAIRVLECMVADMTGAMAGLSARNPMTDVLRQRLDAINAAQDALRAQMEQENPEPLTLDELRSMVGEPVWVVCLDSTWGVPTGWRILDEDRGHVGIWDKVSYLPENEYGTAWLAYCHKPKEEENGNERNRSY